MRLIQLQHLKLGFLFDIDSHLFSNISYISDSAFRNSNFLLGWMNSLSRSLNVSESFLLYILKLLNHKFVLIF